MDHKNESYFCERFDEEVCWVIFLGPHRRVFRVTGYLQCGPCRKRGVGNPYFPRSAHVKRVRENDENLGRPIEVDGDKR